MSSQPPKFSIIIPARQAASTLVGTLESIVALANFRDIEVIVVNDGAEREIAGLAAHYQVTVVDGDGRGLPAALNIGVRSSRGRLLLFTHADCLVPPNWVETHSGTHERFGGMLAVGGSIVLEPKAAFWARCDHYCSWYHVHPRQAAAWVPNHPGANLSVSRSTFEHVGPFREDLPRSGFHEDLEWQGRLLRLGGRIRFEPRAAIWHVDRGDLKGFLLHNYRWGYNSLLVKGSASVSRFPWLYRNPRVLVASFLPFAVAHTAYTVHCWLRVGRVEPLLLSPFLFLGRLAYASGQTIGGLRTIRDGKRS